MKINHTVKDDVAIFSLEGDVMGVTEAVQLNNEINRVLDQGSLKAVIDLDLVNRMNSSGLGILLGAANTFNQNGGQLKLANPSPLVQNLFQMTRLDTVFESYSSLEEALNSFRSL